MYFAARHVVGFTAALVLLVACTPPALAQDTTGTIGGRITDPQGLPIPGASVSAIGAQGPRGSATDAEGRFVIPFLTPGQYTVRAEARGFKPTERTSVDVSAGMKLDLTLRMDVGGVSVTVAVTVDMPAIDPSTTTVGSVLIPEVLTVVPVGRTLAQMLHLTPGVSSSGTLGNENPSMSGGTGLENQYLIDGANITNIGFGALGSFSHVFGSLGNATPVDFIGEIQVKTGGYGAEFGQATGGIVNIVTKSGTNTLRGSGFAYLQPTGLQAAPMRYQSTNGSVNAVGTSVNDAGFETGFPVMRNRLFFFGAVDLSSRITTLNAPAGDMFPLNALGDIDQRRRTLSYLAKGTIGLGSGNRVDASFFGDPSHGANGPQRMSALLVQDTSSFSAFDFGGHQQALRYSGAVGHNWLIEAAFARVLNSVSELPSVDMRRVVDQSVTPTQISGGIGFYESGNRSDSRQWSAKSSRILGPHAIKFGIQYDRAAYAQRTQVTGPPFTASDGRQTATGVAVTVVSDSTYGQIYRARGNFNGERATDQSYLDLFVQDGWRIGSRLVVSGGIRYEQETISGTVVKGWQLKNNWAPRVGATIDPAADGRTKVYGSFGVSFARIPNDLAVVALSNDETVRDDYFDAQLTRPVPEGTLAAGTTRHFVVVSSGADAVDPNARPTYTKETILGIEREILSGTVVDVRYVVRSMPRVLEDVATCPIVAYDLASTSSACGSIQYVITNPSAAIPINPQVIGIDPVFNTVRFDDPVHRYHSLELTVNRRGTRWSTMTSYRWSRLRGNFEGFYRDDNAQPNPGLSSLYDFPTNDPTYTSIGGPLFGYTGDIRLLGDPDGVLPLDRPHQIKAYGNYEWPIGLNIGVGINLSSGRPLTPMASQPNYGDPGEIPLSARGSGIQTVDGFMTRTPFERQVDVQASYMLKVTGNRRVMFVADIFNLFNEKRAMSYDQNTQLVYPTPNPDFGKPISTLLLGNPPQFQAPLAARIGVRVQF